MTAEHNQSKFQQLRFVQVIYNVSILKRHRIASDVNFGKTCFLLEVLSKEGGREGYHRIIDFPR